MGKACEGMRPRPNFAVTNRVESGSVWSGSRCWEDCRNVGSKYRGALINKSMLRSNLLMDTYVGVILVRVALRRSIPRGSVARDRDIVVDGVYGAE